MDKEAWLIVAVVILASVSGLSILAMPLMLWRLLDQELRLRELRKDLDDLDKIVDPIAEQMNGVVRRLPP